MNKLLLKISDDTLTFVVNAALTFVYLNINTAVYYGLWRLSDIACTRYVGLLASIILVNILAMFVITPIALCTIGDMIVSHVRHWIEYVRHRPAKT